MQTFYFFGTFPTSAGLSEDRESLLETLPSKSNVAKHFKSKFICLIYPDQPSLLMPASKLFRCIFGNPFHHQLNWLSTNCKRSWSSNCLCPFVRILNQFLEDSFLVVCLWVDLTPSFSIGLTLNQRCWSYGSHWRASNLMNCIHRILLGRSSATDTISSRLPGLQRQTVRFLGPHQSFYRSVALVRIGH